MDKIFNGQINISRDLRKNKQTVIGKYDLTDILFLFIGFFVAGLLVYFLGFSPFKFVDEFTAILISIFPMIFIISLGFKKTAGIRQINFIRMKKIDKKTKVRANRISDKSQSFEKYIVGFEIDKKYTNKYINKFLNFDNLKILSVRFLRDYKTNKSKIYFILDLKYNNQNDIVIDLSNKFSLNSELKFLSYKDICELEKNLKFEKRKEIDKLNKNKLLNLFNKDKIKINSESVENKNLDVETKESKIYMLNLYDIKVYKKFINKVKRYVEVICYLKRDGKKKYVNTFLIVEDEVKRKKHLTKIEKIDKLCNEYGIILDKLVREQYAGRLAVSFYMTNPFNAYRVYR